MASASCAISVGFRSSAAPGTTNSVSCYTATGFASAASPVAWAGSDPIRSVEDWLPRIDEPVIDPRTGRFNKRWWNYFRVLGERVGGVQGPSITQVVTDVVATQAQVASNTVYVTQVADYASSIDATATATAQVAQTNGLTGSSSIPDTGDRPVPPGHQIP